MDKKKVRKAIAWMENERIIHKCSTYISPSIPKEQINLIEEYYNLAIKALEKQLSKNILISGNSGMQTCPVCRKFMGFKNDEEEKEKYCNNCGQRLDWSE